MRNWIAWNGTAIAWKNDLFETENILHLTVWKEKLLLSKMELIELELFDKNDLLEIEMFLTIKLSTYGKLNCLK